MSWLHAVRLAWPGPRCRISFYNGRPRLPRSTFGCYNAGIFPSNIGCGISEQLFLQQLAHAAEHRPLCRKYLDKYEVQFRTFVRRIVGPPPARISQRNGMILCMSRIWAYTTGPVPVEFRPGQKGARLNTGISLPTLQIYLPNAGWGEHVRTNHFQHTCPWTPTTSLGHYINWKCFARYKASGNWEFVAKNAVQWHALLPCFLVFCSL